MRNSSASIRKPGATIIGILVACMCLCSGLFAGNMKVIASRAGVAPLQPIKASTAPAVVLGDEEYGFMMLHPLSGTDPWTNYFNVPFIAGSSTDREAYTNVVLRYDESRGNYHATPWNITIEYTIKLWNGISTAPAFTYTGESISIDYDPATPYQDKALKRYPNSFRSELKVTAVYVNSVLQTGALAAIYKDVYLDVEQETERYYLLDKNFTPLVKSELLTGTNELEVRWKFIPGAESYDLEWVFIDVDDNPAPNLDNVSADFDFHNATRINLTDQFYRIPLGYPKGILLFRVRGVAADVNDFTLRDEGKWSFIPTTLGNAWQGNTLNDAPVITGVSESYRRNVGGMHLSLNWQYAATFAEDGKRNEVVCFYDGSLRNRQTLTLNNTEGTAIVGETKYDYSGRPAVTLLPTPVESNGIRYYNNFNPGFDRSDFDQEVNVDNPAQLSTVSGAGNFYSTANTTPLGFSGSAIPDAEGYAYSRVRYATDGTDRPVSVSSPGAAHKPGSGHETKFYYGSPSSQDEVDKLFGSNAGERLHYQKNLTVDANGQSAVTYMDQYGRTVATALAGNEPSSLLPIDYRPNAATTTENLLTGNNMVMDGAMVSTTSELVVANSTVYTFAYTLSSDQSCDGCFICKSCVYDLEIAVIDEYGNYVQNAIIISSSCSTSVGGNPIRCTGISSGTYQFSVSLNIGKYQIVKTLVPSESSIAAYRAEYIAYQRTNMTCPSVTPLNPASCDYSCESMCEQQYKSVDENGNVHYYNDQGTEVSAADGAQLIADCITNNCSVQQGPLSECELKHSIMIADLSPGGQYFENLPERFILDADNNLVNNPAYDPNEWLTGLSTTTPSFWTNFNSFIAAATPCSSMTITLASWTDVRSNWTDCFAEYLIRFHPEFCSYDYFCESTLCTKAGNPVYIDVSNSFDLYLSGVNDYNTAVTWNLFNTLALTQNSSYNLATDLVNGNESYLPFAPAGLSPTDPYFDCDPIASQCATASLTIQNEHLTKYYQMQNGKYLSIWYVMEDPGGIHLGNGSPDAQTLAFFQILHGDGTSGNPGLLADPSSPQPGQISRWTFYRASYLFYKQIILQSTFVGNGNCSPLTDSDQDGYTDVGSPITKGFQIRYPENPIYAMYTDDPTNMICTVNPAAQNTAFGNYITTNNTASCEQSCEDYATAWMVELNQNCTLTTQQQTDISFYLTEVCKLDCDGVNTMGSDGCSTCPGTPCSPATTCTGVQLIGNPSVYFYDFEDVITYFTGGACTEVVLHPPTADDADCHCQQLDYFIAQNFSSSPSDADLASAINSAYNYAPADYVTATQVGAWRTECASSSPAVADLETNNFPAELSCLEPNNVTPQYNASACACENIRYFITTMGYDWSITTDRPFIVAGLNAWLNPATGFTETQVQAWITECSSATPDQADLIANGLPLSLQCPVPATTEQTAVTAAYMQAQCQSNNLIVALTGAVAQYNQALEQSADVWEAAFRQNCMNNLPGRETFTMTHTENEYYYTLYYYDQAGNLVQTVPPSGFVPATGPQIVQVQAYRADPNNPSTSPFYPPHTMVTRYKYNSLQQVIESETPDGGLTTYWYDALGRPVLSQDARQAAITSDEVYSYVHYDELGRVDESGELLSPATITWKISRDRDGATSWTAWYTAAVANHREVTYAYYDEENNSTSVTAVYGANWQQNLRNRVSAEWYVSDPSTLSVSGPDAATYYSYDIHGNIKTLVTETNVNDRLYYVDQNLKQINYLYDLWSGNVNEVVYQEGEYDEFRHRYYYDADNRLISAYTSKNGIIWEKESKQFYYAYGPLARTELGDKQVQGTDYAYTIEGWIKGVNSNTLSSARDLGKDGATTTGNLNKWFAYDAAAYSLGYFTNDYKAIDASLNNTSGSFLASETNNGSNPYLDDSYDLYNGNISRMVTVMRDAGGNPIPVQGRTFRYDQLNRIKEVNAWSDASVISTNNWTTAATNNGDYHEEFTFDMNGNIVTAIRNGNLPGTHQYMDNMTYLYTAGTNKLDYVNDLGLALSTDYDMDIEGGQTGGNYQYDAIGNLTKDVSEEIDNIEWNHHGKIVKITRSNTSNKPDLEFLYDASGQRIAKIVKPRVSGTLQTEDKWKYTVYARDASGNVMAVYEFDYKTMSGNNNYRIQHNLKEHHIYGSSRLGISYDQQTEVTRDFTLAVSGNGTFDFYTAPTSIWNTTTQLPAVSTALFKRELGYKVYELTNHLGNVLATVSDRRMPVGSAGVISNFLPEVMTYTDYYVYGSNMRGRTYVNANGKYRYTFNGKEQDVESDLQDYGFRIYNPALAKFLSVDPLTSKYPMLTPYQFASNTPIGAVDVDGLEGCDFKFEGGDNSDGYFGRWDQAMANVEGKSYEEVHKRNQAQNGIAAAAAGAVVLTGVAAVAAAPTAAAAGATVYTTVVTAATSTLYYLSTPQGQQTVVEVVGFVGNIFYDGCDLQTPGPGDELGKIFNAAGKYLGRYIAGSVVEVMAREGRIWGGNQINLSWYHTTAVIGENSTLNIVRNMGIHTTGSSNGAMSILSSNKWYDLQNLYTYSDGSINWNGVVTEFWTNVNKPYMDGMIVRGDVFRMVSDPLVEKNMWVTNEVGEFILDSGGNRIRSIFGMEYDYLLQNGYTQVGYEMVKKP